MKYLTVPAFGSGTEDDPIRPDLPEGTSFVGQHDPESGTYFVAVPKRTDVGVKAGRLELSTKKQKDGAVAAWGLRTSDVDAWRVSDDPLPEALT